MQTLSKDIYRKGPCKFLLASEELANIERAKSLYTLGEDIYEKDFVKSNTNTYLNCKFLQIRGTKRHLCEYENYEARIDNFN